MPQGASRTAEFVCLFRAVETHRPPPARVLEDPYAETFLPRSWRIAARSPLARAAFFAWKRALPLPLPFRQASMLQAFVAVRHREIDERLRAFLASGGTQVVVLGAGYDTRAMRFADELAGKTLIEVDFPATQEKKRALIDKRLPGAAGHVAAYLPIDFLHDTLQHGLDKPPFRAGVRTLFIWEGVAMYLTPDAVASTLATLAALGGSGSEIVCDMWAKPRVAGLGDFMAAVRNAGAGMLSWLGEPLHFSLAAAETPGFFLEHGWVVSEVLDGAGMTTKWDRAVFPDCTIVHALRAD